MSTVAGTTRFVGTSVPRREDRALLTGQGRFIDNLTLPGTVYMAVVRSPYPRARIRGVSLDPARAAEGVVAAYSGADLAEDWKGSLPCAWPVTEDIKMPPHYPLATDEARFQGDGVAVVIADSRGRGERRGGAGRGRLRAARGRRRGREGACRRCAARPLRPGHERVLRLDARDRRLRRRARGCRRDRDAALLPASPDPERDRAARRARAGRPDRRADALVGHAGTAHPALRPAARAGHPGGEDPRDRTRRRRRLRLQAERLCGGGARRDARPPAGPAGEVDRGALRERRRHDPRARRRHRVHLRGDEGRHDHVRQGRGEGGDGRVSAAGHAWHPTARRVDLQRRLRDPQLQRSVHRRVHERDADRRVPRGRTPGSDVRDRADDGSAGGRARHGPHRVAPQELHQGVPGHACVRPHRRLRELRRGARQAARAPRSRHDPHRAGRPPRTRRHRSSSASGSRPTTRCAGSRPRASSARSATRWEAGTAPPIRFQPLGSVQVVTGTSPHGQGHETSWAQIAADALGVDVDDVEVLHGDTAVSQLGMDTYGSRSLAVGGIALCARERESRRRRRERSSRTSSKSPARTSSSPTAASR